jgi:putative PIN family toxin of toxin-antitoxin system
VRLVLDTSVLVAGLRSPRGASSRLLEAAVAGKIRPLISVALALEYEAVLTRPEHLSVAGYETIEAVKLVKAICATGEPVHIPYRLRPQLSDPDDEFVLEAAYHGKADIIVTFSRRGFEFAATRFRIGIVSPSEAMRRLGIR